MTCYRTPGTPFSGGWWCGIDALFGRDSYRMEDDLFGSNPDLLDEVCQGTRARTRHGFAGRGPGPSGLFTLVKGSHLHPNHNTPLGFTQLENSRRVTIEADLFICTFSRMQAHLLLELFLEQTARTRYALTFCLETMYIGLLQGAR